MVHNTARRANVFTFSRERGLMAARLSAPTQSHNHSPRDKSGYRSRHAGDGLARRLQRAVRRSDEPAITSLLVGEYPVARIAPKSGADLTEPCSPHWVDWSASSGRHPHGHSGTADADRPRACQDVVGCAKQNAESADLLPEGGVGGLDRPEIREASWTRSAQRRRSRSHPIPGA